MCDMAQVLRPIFDLLIYQAINKKHRTATASLAAPNHEIIVFDATVGLMENVAGMLRYIVHKQDRSHSTAHLRGNQLFQLFDIVVEHLA